MSLLVAADAMIVIVIAFCALSLTVRYFVLPNIDMRRAQIERLLSDQIGQPVEMGSLRGGWNGWDPRLDVSDLRILDRENGSELMRLPETHLTISWSSLFYLSLQLRELSLNQPRLAIRRDSSGILHIAGFALDPKKGDGDQSLLAWLLRQPRIVIRDAEIVWRDESRGAPELVLEHVVLRTENRFGHYRLGLTAEPPADVAAPLDFRGDFSIGPTLNWRAASGRFYARFDYADIGAWREWLPVEVPIKSGKGGVRVWFELSGGHAHDVIADVILADARFRLAPDLPELALTRIEGRLGLTDDGEQRQIRGEHLEFSGPTDLRMDPTDFKWATRSLAEPRVGTAGRSAGGSAEFSSIELAPLLQMANYVPLPPGWRDDLARWAPRGRLDKVNAQWSGDVSEPDDYNVTAQLVDVGFAPQERVPGLGGVSGDLKATRRDGTLKLASRALSVQRMHATEPPLVFDTVRGQLRWSRQEDKTTGVNGSNAAGAAAPSAVSANPGPVVIAADQLNFENADLAVVVNGEYRTDRSTLGAATVDAQLTRADLRQLYRYFPGPADSSVRAWLKSSLIAGTASDGHLKLEGNLADFPSADPKKGQFQASFKARGVTLDYAAHWPALTNLDADLRFDGPRLMIDGRAARVYGIGVERMKVDIADLRVPYPVMQLDGIAVGTSSDFLRFVAESPVDGWLDHALAGAEASGDGRLTLKLEMPIGRHENDQVNGEYAFNANRLKLGGDVPELDHLNGALAFSQREIHGAALTAEILGGPARLAVNGANGKVDIDGEGSLDLNLLRTAYPRQPLAARLSGVTDWRLALKLGSSIATWQIDSTLTGAVVDLPQPANKTATTSVPLRIERRQIDADSDALLVSYGSLGRLELWRRLTPGGPVPERGVIALGKARTDGAGNAGAAKTGTKADTDRRGLSIRGDVDALNLDAWLALKTQSDELSGPMDLSLTGVDLNLGVIDVMGKQLHDLTIGATRTGADWQVDLRGRELEGTAHWQAPAAGRPNGRVVARLQRLTPPTATPAAPAAVATTTALNADNTWPAIDIVADVFKRKDRDLGKLELVAQPRGTDWHIESLQLTNPDGKLSASGWWRNSDKSQQTTLDTDLDVVDAGKFLARFEMPDSIRNARTKIHGQMSWAGGPQEFDYPTLSGDFRLETGTGQFTKLDPGLGKLLGVLSLQSLKRRLTFDFQDLFGEGFAFDEITGDVHVKDGVMHSENLRIVGPSARVQISGEADIGHETQQLRVRVLPTLSAGVSMGAAALWLANPLVGVAVAAGSLLAQKVLQDPIEQMFAYEYSVTGSWADPIVDREGKTSTAIPSTTDKRGDVGESPRNGAAGASKVQAIAEAAVPAPVQSRVQPVAGP